ncbi:MAG: Arc family DNA-binding protein [Synechococcales bacterium]|nr:Arc family DNA-binding protein [Synechococcales bacterium]
MWRESVDKGRSSLGKTAILELAPSSSSPPMSPSEVISAEIPIPSSLYDAIVQRAQSQGHSITSEILALLTNSLEQESLQQEIAAWESATDEDWLAFATTLHHEAQ